MTVDAVQDNRLATDGAVDVCGPWWLQFIRWENERFRRDLAETRRAYDEMKPLVAAVEGRQEE